MDVLYVLDELQEEGLIRSVGLQDFPPAMITEAISNCGFTVSLIQQPGSLLLPPNPDQLIVSSVEHQWITDPFLNDLLLLEATTATSQRKRGSLPVSKQYNRQPQTNEPDANRWKSTLQKWAKVHGITSRDEDRNVVFDSEEIWSAFEKEVTSVLQDMSWRYGVTVKSLLLRWMLELDHASSVVIPVPNGAEWNDMDFSSTNSKWRGHVQELRAPFTFCIEEEDKHILREISREHKDEIAQNMVMDLDTLEEFLVKQGLPESKIEALLEEQEQQQQQQQQQNDGTSTDYPMIDFDNPKLWL